MEIRFNKTRGERKGKEGRVRREEGRKGRKGKDVRTNLGK